MNVINLTSVSRWGLRKLIESSNWGERFVRAGLIDQQVWGRASDLLLKHTHIAKKQEH